METQVQKISSEVKNNLNLADDKASVVERYVKRAINQIKIFCNREDIPITLEDTVAQIVEDMLRADQVVTTPKEVSSISRGDTSFSYRNKTAEYGKTVDFMKNYEKSLIHFRKMKVPATVGDKYD